MKKLLLTIGLFLASFQIVNACPVISEGAEINRIYASEMQEDPFYFPVVAGGQVNLANCGFAGGWVVPNPDFSLYMYDFNGPVQFSVSSPGCDTVLLLNAPDGSWYYDDDSSGDLMPWIEAYVGDGRMDVWVGTFGGDYCDASLVVY